MNHIAHYRTTRKSSKMNNAIDILSKWTI